MNISIIVTFGSKKKEKKRKRGIRKVNKAFRSQIVILSKAGLLKPTPKHIAEAGLVVFNAQPGRVTTPPEDQYINLLTDRNTAIYHPYGICCLICSFTIYKKI